MFCFIIGPLVSRFLQPAKMKIFAAKVEEGKEGRDGEPSVGPVYRSLLSKNGFPPPEPNLTTSWDLFR